MYLWPLRTVWFRSLFCFIEHHYWAISMLINVMRIVRSHSPHVATVVSPWRRLNYIVLGDSWSCKIDVKVMALDFFLAVNIFGRQYFEPCYVLPTNFFFCCQYFAPCYVLPTIFFGRQYFTTCYVLPTNIFRIFYFFWPSIFRAVLCCADEFFFFGMSFL